MVIITLLSGLALSLFASTHPADPAPTTIKSASKLKSSFDARYKSVIFNRKDYDYFI